MWSVLCFGELYLYILVKKVDHLNMKSCSLCIVRDLKSILPHQSYLADNIMHAAQGEDAVKH